MPTLLSTLGLDSGLDLLRILCGAFLLPHLVVKFRNQDFVKGFMAEAGLRPPSLWLYSALGVEVVAALGLIFDIYARYAAILAGIFLVIAAYASWVVSKRKWMWNFGGAEYPLFWALCCFIVAVPATA